MKKTSKIAIILCYIKYLNYFEKRVDILTDCYIQCDHMKKTNFRKASLFTRLLPVYSPPKVKGHAWCGQCTMSISLGNDIFMLYILTSQLYPNPKHDSEAEGRVSEMFLKNGA